MCEKCRNIEQEKKEIKIHKQENEHVKGLLKKHKDEILSLKKQINRSPDTAAKKGMSQDLEDLYREQINNMRLENIKLNRKLTELERENGKLMEQVVDLTGIEKLAQNRQNIIDLKKKDEMIDRLKSQLKEMA